MNSSAQRNRDARALAEAGYATLLQAVGSNRGRLLLIGGLVPEHLVDSDEPHQGTNDVDILLDIGLVYDRDDLDFAWLEDALETAGFVTSTPNTGWRWVKDISGFPIQVEFLVDVPTTWTRRSPYRAPRPWARRTSGVQGPRSATSGARSWPASARW